VQFERDYGDAILTALALATIPVAIADSAALPERDHRVLVAVSWIVYSAFLVNFLIVVLPRNRAQPLTRQIVWDVPILVGQPLLAILVAGSSGSIVAVLRVFAVLARGLSESGSLRRAWRRIAGQPLRAVLLAMPFLLLLWSSVLLRAELDETGSISSLGDGLWWGVVTMATVGYGDIAPTSTLGRMAAVGAMITGIAAFSVVTAKLAESLLATREDLGRVSIDDEEHLLLLGWAPRIFTLVRQLLIANESRPGACIVILSERPHREAEAELRARLPELTRSRCVVRCRTGSPQEPTDLARVNPQSARAIVIALHRSQTTETVTTILALLTSQVRPHRDTPVIAEIADPSVAASISAAFGDQVLIVQPDDLIARITAQSCRQPGLGLVYEEVLDFEGSELYIVDAPVDGRVFGEVLHLFEDCVPLGYIDGKGESVLLCPPSTDPIPPEHRLVVLAPDDSLIECRASDLLPEHGTPQAIAAASTEEHILVVGWNSMAPRMLLELERYLSEGSTITILASSASCHPNLEHRVGSSIDVAVIDGDVRGGDGRLDELVDASDHIIVLGDRALDPRDADARVLLTTLRIRNRIIGRATTLVTELVDERSVTLGRQAGVAEFVVSDKLTSLLMAQLAETPALLAVFDHLLDPDSADFITRPSGELAAPGVGISFAAIVDRARHLDEIAIGYRIANLATSKDHNFGVVINPAGSTTVVFEPEDRVVLLHRPTRALMP
jgi:voltage-gated potassium channel Kch